MGFKEAYEVLKQGTAIKLPEWEGYWKWEDSSVKMHLKGGIVLDIRQAPDIDCIFKAVIRNDWEKV